MRMMSDHKKWHLVFLFSLVAALLTSGCKSRLIISRGTSFGHCVGNCNKELQLKKGEAIYSFWANGNQPGAVKVVRVIPNDIHRALVKSFDFKNFYSLPETIGCPDCADGGAEWISVQSGNKIRRVTFEYGHTPEKLKPAVEQLKEIQKTFEK